MPKSEGMRKYVMILLGVWILAASSLEAQILPIPPAPRDLLDTASRPNDDARAHAVFEPFEGYNPDAFRFWARCEYTLGMAKRAPLPIPLVTIGDAKAKQPGAIGQSTTQVQLGNAAVGFKVISGV